MRSSPALILSISVISHSETIVHTEPHMVLVIALVLHGLGMAIIVSTMLGGNRSRSDLPE